jgi:hypothetical protein
MQKIFDFFKPLPDVPRIEDQEKIKKQYFYWRVRTFLAIYLGYCVFYFTRKNMSPALHIFSKELNVDIVQLGIISSVFYITYGVGKLVAGMMAERLNVRAFMATGLFLSSVVNLFYGNLTSIWMLSFFWGLNGLFQAAGYPPVAKSLVAWFGPTERTEKWSWWSSSHTAGTLGIGLLVGLLINSWREKFGKTTPFYFVQLATYDTPGNSNDGCNWAELREAQTNALKLENTGMVVTTDIGNPKDIHPRNKKTVGERLTNLALKNNLKSPVFNDFSIEGNKIIITFNTKDVILLKIALALLMEKKYSYLIQRNL